MPPTSALKHSRNSSRTDLHLLGASESVLKLQNPAYSAKLVLITVLRGAGTIESEGPWDTLSIDIVGPLLADQRREYVITFVDCFLKYTILLPSRDHTAITVSNALLNQVIPYFGVPRRLLSDRLREFMGQVWDKLHRALGIRLLTSLYHPQRNASNERSHCSMNNMLRALLYDGTPAPHWIDKITSIMLTLNSMPRQTHRYSASMIATGHKNTLPPDLVTRAQPSEGAETPSACDRH